MRNLPFLARGSLVVILAILAVSVGLVAEHERMIAAALEAGTSDPTVTTLGLRITLALLLFSIALLGCLLFVLSRTESDAGEGVAIQAQELVAGSVSVPSVADTQKGYLSALSSPSTEVGGLIAVGSLARGFCHELNNALAPIQGFADLLAGNGRLDDLHRRQAARIAEAAAAALVRVQNFAVANSWRDDPTSGANLSDIVTMAVAVVQSALGARIAVATPPARAVQVNATEAQIGQAILHVWAAVASIANGVTSPVEVQVDSVIGAAEADADSGTVAGRGLEIWSDPFDVDRTSVQLGTVHGSWRYGRVQIRCKGGGWDRDFASRLFGADFLESHEASHLSMDLLGGMMTDAGGVIRVDTCPRLHLQITLMWQARVIPDVIAPLEVDTVEDELDALIVHAAEAEAEALSRRLGQLGLHVASTTSPETALDLITEMGQRCRSVLIGDTRDAELGTKVSRINTMATIVSLQSITGSRGHPTERWSMTPNEVDLARLAAHIRHGGRAERPS